MLKQKHRDLSLKTISHCKDAKPVWGRQHEILKQIQRHYLIKPNGESIKIFN